MKKALVRFNFGLVLFSSLLGSLACATAIDVVQSVPVETTLQVPGIPLTDQVWIDMINSAKRSIDLEQFYINNKNGQSLEPVLQALMLAAGRGVQIRLIVDIEFMKNYPDVPTQFSNIKNMQVRIVDFKNFGGIQHAKFFIVDQGLSFLGSANFDWLAMSHIHEVGLKIEDAQVAASLAQVFARDWAKAKPIAEKQTQEMLAKVGGKPTRQTGIQVLASPNADVPAGLGQSLGAILNLISAAKKSVKIQVYQYSTDNGKWLTLDNALRAAAKRGVQVKLMVDSVALKKSSKELKALAATPNIQVKTVTIPEWSGGHLDYARLVHSKYFTVDATYSWVGTENWSEGYFTGCRNVGVILPIQSITAKLDQIYDRLWTSAYVTSL